MVPKTSEMVTKPIRYSAENLRYGDPEASDTRVEASAVQARFMDDVRGFPDGFKTLVGERGITLSGGQRQRAALGRALLIRSPVIVLDDALASVDNKTASGILSSIRDKDKKTILMISHQLSAAAACDRILVIEEGRLVQEGQHADLIKRQGTYKRLWDREKANEQLEAVA